MNVGWRLIKKLDGFWQGIVPVWLGINCYSIYLFCLFFLKRKKQHFIGKTSIALWLNKLFMNIPLTNKWYLKRRKYCAHKKLRDILLLFFLSEMLLTRARLFISNIFFSSEKKKGVIKTCFYFQGVSKLSFRAFTSLISPIHVPFISIQKNVAWH